MADETLDIAPQSGFAALAASGADDADEPFTVHGVAIGEGDITEGASGTRTHWPADTLAAAADGLAGKKIVDDSEHDDLDARQPPISAILGEVTQSTYEPGIGVVFEGEIDDPDIASLVENGRVDVSPALFRELGELDESVGAKPATEIHKWRDLSVVAEGAAPSNTIRPGVAALQAEALAQALDANVDTEREAVGKLTEHERQIVHEARAMDAPMIAESDGEALAISGEEAADYTLVDRAQYQRSVDRIEAVRDECETAIVKHGALSDRTVEQLPFGALMATAEDIGESTADALAQEPETGGVEPANGSPPSADSEELASLLTRARQLSVAAPERAGELREQAAALANVESYEDIDMERV